MPNNFKVALEVVGKEEAIRGNFAFWRPFAIKEKIIDPDQASLTLIPSNLGAHDNLDEQNLDAIRDRLLSASRSMEDQGEPLMVEDAGGGERESDSERAAPLPE